MQYKDFVAALTDSTLYGLLSESTFLPDAIPGETVFSWTARYHRLSGHASVSLTNRVLFGKREWRLRHDFPANLRWFCEKTGNLMGDAERIARERTTLGFFLPFLSEAQAYEAIASLSDGHISRLNFQSQGLNHRL